MLGQLGAGRLERGLVDLVLQHPVAGEFSGLDVGQHALHLGLGRIGDDARAGDVFAILGGVGDRVVHVGDAAFIDQVDDQLYFVQAFEIGHFRSITGFGERFETSADEFDETAAENDLFAEEVGFALFAEIGFDDARTATADAAGVGQREFKRVAGRVLVNGNEAGNAAAL